MSNPTTREEAITAYLANADYADGAGDVTKARAFRTACTALLILQPTEINQNGVGRKVAVEVIPKQLAKVDDWLAAVDVPPTPAAGAAGVRYVDLTESRE